MRRTRPVDALILFVLVGIAVFFVTRAAYGELPSVQWFTAVPVAILAVADFVAAGRVRAAVGHRPGAKPITALAVARCVALAKASILGGAGVAGAAAGLLARVAPKAAEVHAAGHDTVVAVVLLAAAIALAVAGRWLETAAIDPSHTS